MQGVQHETSLNLQSEGFTATNIDTRATVILEEGTISEIQFDVKVNCRGLKQKRFEELVNNAKTDCPVSKLLNTTITLTQSLQH